MLQSWIHAILFLIARISSGNVVTGLGVYILDALVGETLLVKAWHEHTPQKSINISRDEKNLLSAFFKPNFIILYDKRDAILIQYENSTGTISLRLQNVKKGDHGIYNVEESVEDAKSDVFERTSGGWKFKLNVIESKELRHCIVGQSIKMKFIPRPTASFYYYDQMVAYFHRSDCRVVDHSHLQGRMRCSTENDRHTISIENITQKDIGVYTLVADINDTQRYYLNVTDQENSVTIGENVVLNWYYSQQGINRTLLVIHPNNGIMMKLFPDNQHKIEPAFQDRLLYRGNISIVYMSFTLLNVTHSDFGTYKIKTQHGLTLPGCKDLIVKVVPSVVQLPDEYTESHLLTVRMTSPKNPNNTSEIYMEAKYVVFGAVGFIILLIGCLIWMHNMNTGRNREDGSHSLKECETNSYLAPVGGDNNHPVPSLNDVDEADFGTAKSRDGEDSGTDNKVLDEVHSATSQSGGEVDSGKSKLGDEADSRTAKLGDEANSGTAKLADEADSGTFQSVDEADSGTAKLGDKTDSGTAKLTDKTDSGTAKLGDETDSGTAKLGDKTDSGTAKLADEADSGTSQSGDEADSGTAKLGNKADSGTAKLGDKTDSGTAKLGDKTDSGTAKLGDKTYSGTAKLGEETDSGTSQSGDEANSGTAKLADETDYGTSQAETKHIPVLLS